MGNPSFWSLSLSSSFLQPRDGTIFLIFLTSRLPCTPLLGLLSPVSLIPLLKYSFIERPRMISGVGCWPLSYRNLDNLLITVLLQGGSGYLGGIIVITINVITLNLYVPIAPKNSTCNFTTQKDNIQTENCEKKNHKIWEHLLGHFADSLCPEHSSQAIHCPSESSWILMKWNWVRQNL